MKLVHVSAYFAAKNHNLVIFVPQLLDMVVSFGCLFDNILWPNKTFDDDQDSNQPDFLSEAQKIYQGQAQTKYIYGENKCVSSRLFIHFHSGFGAKLPTL